jgi:signal peptidase I
VYINGKKQKEIPGKQYNYVVTTDGSLFNPKTLDKLKVANDDREMFSGGRYLFPLTGQQLSSFHELKNVSSIAKNLKPKGNFDPDIFPHSPDYAWNVDNFGPLYIPKKGITVNLSLKNLPIYERIIGVYERNDLKVKNGQILINGKPATQYTFKLDYYWMMGDNRHKSADSRYWGFVPIDHVVGKASIIWMSLDKDKKFPANIRFNRILKGVQ